jgi:hypothetical protein
LQFYFSAATIEASAINKVIIMINQSNIQQSATTDYTFADLLAHRSSAEGVKEYAHLVALTAAANIAAQRAADAVCGGINSGPQ